jgi:tetratricopeptide (TPR) repeat protein
VPVERAFEALRLAEADPAQAIELALSISRVARRQLDYATASVAEQALGVAATHLEDVDSAIRHFRVAVTYADRAGSHELAVDARLRLAFALNSRGRAAAALREIDRLAAMDLKPHHRTRSAAQRGVILSQLGRYDEAIVDLDRAVWGLRQSDDPVWLQRVLSNRGVLQGYRHKFAAAAADLHAAERLCLDHGLELSLAFVHQNLGWVLGMQGDVPGALRFLDQAQDRLAALGADLAEVLADRSQILTSALLMTEAREAAERAVALCDRNGRTIMASEVRLLLAHAALLSGEPDLAAAHAARAIRDLERQKRPGWATLGRYLLARARVESGTAAPVGVRHLDRLAASLSVAGWLIPGIETRILAGRLAMARGQRRESHRQLELAARSRTRGPVIMRVRAWYAEALLRESRGDRRAAWIAVRCGLKVIDDHRATFGATDLRARASGHRIDLAELGLAMALDDGRPERVLTWAEEGRASHLRLRPVRPPQDTLLAQTVADLRATVRDIEQAVGEDRPVRRLLQRRIELERAVRDHTRRLDGDASGPARARLSAATLGAALGDAALVEFVRNGSELYAVTVVGGRATLHPLGSLGRTTEIVDSIPFALRRLARAYASPAGRRAAWELLRHTAAELDELVLRPLDALIHDRPLVLVPTTPLQSLPWSVLPSCRGRAVTVAPSAALWLAAHDTPHRGRGVTVAAGPGLPGAEAEAVAVAAAHGVPALIGGDAKVDAVAAAIDGAHLAHIAAHGRVHPRNSLFSAIDLDDGPLAVHDLERLDRTPDLVVLSACNVGAATVTAGDELLGLGATFLAQGAQQIVASVIPLPDAATTPLMTAFHRRLVAGESAAVALAAAQSHVDDDDPAAVAAAAGFVCMGADRSLALAAAPVAGPAIPALERVAATIP